MLGRRCNQMSKALHGFTALTGMRSTAYKIGKVVEKVKVNNESAI